MITKIFENNGLSAAVNSGGVPKIHPCGKASTRQHVPRRVTELKVVPGSMVRNVSRTGAGICNPKRMMLSPQGGSPYRLSYQG